MNLISFACPKAATTEYQNRACLWNGLSLIQVYNSYIIFNFIALHRIGVVVRWGCLTYFFKKYFNKL